MCTGLFHQEARGEPTGSKVELQRVHPYDQHFLLSALISGMTIVVVLSGLLVGVALIRSFVVRPHNGIPVAGISEPVLSYISCIRFLAHAQNFMEDAYQRLRTRAGMFQFRVMNEWRVIVHDKQAMSEVFDSATLLFIPGVCDTYQFGYTVHPSLSQNAEIYRPYLRYILANLDPFLPEMMKEIELTFESKLSVNDGRFNVSEVMTEAVFRGLNVMLVGSHLTRDAGFRKEMLNAVQGILGTGILLKLSPPFTRPLLHKLLSLFIPTTAKSHKMMLTEIQRRKRKVAQGRGEWDSSAIDVLSQFARDYRLTDDENMMAVHFIVLNLAGTFSTILTMTQVIFDLMQQEGCLPRIREELEAAINHDDSKNQGEVTPEVLASCHYLDAFLKESMRLCNLGVLHITRVATKDFTFSNGVKLTPGTTVSIPTGWTHHNDAVYPDPYTFDPSRFISEDTTQADPTNLNPDYLFFGYGKRACPGRNLALRTIKCIVAHLVLNYDLSWARPGFKPKSMWVMFYHVPDPKAEIVISKRKLRKGDRLLA